jgi:hypothetical protein
MMFMDCGPAPKVARADPPENGEDNKFGRFLASYGVVTFMGTISLIGVITIGVIKILSL